MFKRTLGVLTAVFLVCTGAMWAQAPAGPPKPGPEHKRMAPFVGTWKGSGEMKAGPWGPSGKMTYTETCEWFEGGFSLVCRSEGNSPMGRMKGLSVLGYKPGDKQYFYTAINSLGEGETAIGTVEGKTWNWTGETKMGGKSIKSRFTIVEQSNDAQTFKLETSIDGGPWTVGMEGKATRAK